VALFPILLDHAAGEYMRTVLVTEWHKTPGEAVRIGEVLVTVETAKAATEVEADRDGWLAVIDVPIGQEAPLGVALGHLTDTESEHANAAPERAATRPVLPDAPQVARGARIRASPYARRLARERNVALDRVTGSGPGARIKARDLPVSGKQVQGFETPTVLLHGFGADRTAWHGLRSLLSGLVIALDLPGHGSRVDRPAHSIEAIAEDIAAQLDERGVEEIHLVGHSLGGAAALALIASGRVSVRSLALIAPAGLGAPVSRGFTQALLEARSQVEMQAVLEQLVADPAHLPHALAAASLKQLEDGDNRDTLSRMEQALFGQGRAFDQSAVLARLSIPVRVIRGAADCVIPQVGAKMLPAQVALHVIPGIGHMPQIEAPDLVARLLFENQRSAR
jgi:pyruvate dehydrogenase E2 component (dihydrolipoamide acetyltransferase)